MGFRLALHSCCVGFVAQIPTQCDEPRDECKPNGAKSLRVHRGRADRLNLAEQRAGLQRNASEFQSISHWNVDAFATKRPSPLLEGPANGR
jgi:hypothetical protein